jgi:DNA-binding PadR family transcriptional regulator
MVFAPNCGSQTMRTPASPSLMIEHALLGFVYDSPLHGYEIYRRLSDPAGLWQVWRLKQSQLYALLTKLEEKGYLTATLQSQEGRPPRKIYALHEAGRVAFCDWLATPVAHGRQMRIEFLAKLYFAHRQEPLLVLHLIEHQIDACQRWLGTFQPPSKAMSEPDFFGYAVQQFRYNQVESFLAWLAACRQELLVATQST